MKNRAEKQAEKYTEDQKAINRKGFDQSKQVIFKPPETKGG